MKANSNLNQKIQTAIAAIVKQRNRRDDDLPVMHRRIGKLRLPTGRLVACDPFCGGPGDEPFTLQLPCGGFPVLVSTACIPEGQFITHASILFSTKLPVRWERMTMGDEGPEELAAGKNVGYPTETGTGCFFDFSMAHAMEPLDRLWMTLRTKLAVKMIAPDFNPLFGFKVQLGSVNLIAFPASMRCMDGTFAGYGTFAGFDAGGKVCAVVTDF